MDNERKKNISDSMNHLLKMDSALALDCINYVFTQLNNESYMGKINESEYVLLVKRANAGLNKIIYLKHYTRDIVAKKAFQTAASNLLIILYTRPLNGNDRMLLLEEMKSKQPITITK